MSAGPAAAAAILCDVLDDDTAVGEVICGILARNGVRHRYFTNLADHLDAMAEQHPDLVFLDVRLVEADAVDAIRRFAALGYAGYIQMVSGLDPQRLFDMYRMSERYGYRALYPIGKPFRSMAIKAALDHVRDRHEMLSTPRLTAAPELRAGWVSSTSAMERPTLLIAQPHLIADPTADDLFTRAETLPLLRQQLADATFARGMERAPLVWAHTRLETALSVEVGEIMRSLEPQNNPPPLALLPLSDATGNPVAFGDLKARFSVYGLALGLFAGRLEDVSISTLSSGVAETLVLGEDLIASVMASAAGRMLAERALAAARGLGMQIVAMGDAGSEAGQYLSGLGVAQFAPPLAAMVTPDRLTEIPLPSPMPLPVAAAKPHDVLPDFAGRHLLSEREQQIVQLTVNGQSAKEAARTLGLSYRTIEVHRTNIARKLGVKNVAQLARLVIGSS